MLAMLISCNAGMQNFILIAGAETRRTFAKDEERKYPGTA